jgi:hypothetical protein
MPILVEDVDPSKSPMAPENAGERPNPDHISDLQPFFERWNGKIPKIKDLFNLRQTRQRVGKLVIDGTLTSEEIALLRMCEESDLAAYLDHLEIVTEKGESRMKGDGTKELNLPEVKSFNPSPGIGDQNGKTTLEILDNKSTQEEEFGIADLREPESETDHNKWGEWGTAKKGSHLDSSDNVQEGTYGDHESEYEEPSEQDHELPSRSVQPAPFGYPNTLQNPALKSSYDLLVQDGMLISEEIQLLEASGGTTLRALLKYFETIASKRALDAEAVRLSAPKGYPYRVVHVLLLEWEEDDLGMNQAVSELRSVFEGTFGFESVKSFKIPSRRSYNALEARLQEFKQQNSSEQNLLIVYYSGHGFLDLQNRMHWAAKGEF